jgi:hypothetical protein
MCCKSDQSHWPELVSRDSGLYKIAVIVFAKSAMVGSVICDRLSTFTTTITLCADSVCEAQPSRTNFTSLCLRFFPVPRVTTPVLPSAAAAARSMSPIDLKAATVDLYIIPILATMRHKMVGQHAHARSRCAWSSWIDRHHTQSHGIDDDGKSVTDDQSRMSTPAHVPQPPLWQQGTAAPGTAWYRRELSR